MTKVKYECNFHLGVRVYMDGEQSIVGKVTMVWWMDGSGPVYEVSWWHDGHLLNANFREWRLTEVRL